MTSQVLEALNVSRETRAMLSAYVDLLLKWNERINLISRISKDDVWKRHVEDSAQLCRYVPHRVQTWLDFGSGGGLPGVVVAILLSEKNFLGKMVLVESDRRKAAFLLEVSRCLSLGLIVKDARIESLDPIRADVISARALTSLDALIGLSMPHVTTNTRLLFPKGAGHQEEIEGARQNWAFDLALHRSMTDDRAAIVEITHPRPIREGGP